MSGSKLLALSEDQDKAAYSLELQNKQEDWQDSFRFDFVQKLLQKLEFQAGKEREESDFWRWF